MYTCVYIPVSISQLLQSPLVGPRLYSNQMEEVYQLFLSQASREGVVNLEQFIPIAHTILQMIYKNSYPTQVRME